MSFCLSFAASALLALAAPRPASEPVAHELRAPAQSPAHTTAHRTAPDAFFPLPTGPLALRGVETEHVIDLLRQLEELTGVHFVLSRDSASVASKHELDLVSPLEVPAEQAWGLAEELLAAADFVLVPCPSTSVPLLRVVSLDTNERNAIRRNSFHVAPEELEAWSDHPAVLITSLVHVPHLNAPQTANVSRTILIDANTQQIVPLGERVLLLTGFASGVVSFARELRWADQRAAEDAPASAEARSAER